MPETGPPGRGILPQSERLRPADSAQAPNHFGSDTARSEYPEQIALAKAALRHQTSQSRLRGRAFKAVAGVLEGFDQNGQKSRISALFRREAVAAAVEFRQFFDEPLVFFVGLNDRR